MCVHRWDGMDGLVCAKQLMIVHRLLPSHRASREPAACIVHGRIESRVVWHLVARKEVFDSQTRRTSEEFDVWLVGSYMSSEPKSVVTAFGLAYRPFLRVTVEGSILPEPTRRPGHFAVADREGILRRQGEGGTKHRESGWKGDRRKPTTPLGVEVHPTHSRNDAIRYFQFGNPGFSRLASGVRRMAFIETECEADIPRLRGRHVAGAAAFSGRSQTRTRHYEFAKAPCVPNNAPLSVFVRFPVLKVQEPSDNPPFSMQHCG